MSVYACLCEVDRDAAPVSAWCEPCQSALIEGHKLTVTELEGGGCSLSTYGRDGYVEGCVLVGRVSDVCGGGWYWEADARSLYGDQGDVAHGSGEGESRDECIRRGLLVLLGARHEVEMLVAAATSAFGS